jgi:hypothetical protein
MTLYRLQSVFSIECNKDVVRLGKGKGKIVSVVN